MGIHTLRGTSQRGARRATLPHFQGAARSLGSPASADGSKPPADASSERGDTAAGDGGGADGGLRKLLGHNTAGLAALAGTGSGRGSIDSAVDFLRRAANLEVAQQYEIARANHRLASALSGDFEIVPDTTCRVLGVYLWAVSVGCAVCAVRCGAVRMVSLHGPDK